MIGWNQRRETCVAEEGGFAYAAARTFGIQGFHAAHDPGSRGDFFQALQLLGAGPAVRHLGGITRLMARVHATCSREQWVQIFGEPECVEEHSLPPPSSRHALHLWKHFCSDGPVTCLGHLFVQSTGMPWVVVMRVACL